MDLLPIPNDLDLHPIAVVGEPNVTTRIGPALLRNWSAASATLAPMISACSSRTSSRQIDRLDLAILPLSHASLSLWSVGIVIGENLQCLAVLGH